MKDCVRLDKFLAEMGKGTRSEVKKYIRDGRVSVDGVIQLRPETKVYKGQEIRMDGQALLYESFKYYLMNKPAGLISATEDERQQTVIDLISDRGRRNLFPVGRLDKDTTGLLLITDDGVLAHRLLSPRKHVAKVYRALVAGNLDQTDIQRFREGISVEEDWTTLPAELNILKAGRESLAEITIYEGKFHQIKRMFAAIGKPVLSLERIAMGPLRLPDDLGAGQYRPLTDTEYEALMQLKGNE